MMKKKIIKKLVLAVTCFAVVVTACMVTEKKQAASEIPEHNGEVLVDSLNVLDEAEIQAEKGSDESEETSAEAELVTSDDVSELEQSDSYFQEMRATINLDRNQVISMLTDAETTAENSSEKSNASEKKETLMSYMQMEQDVEGAILAKGLPESLVLITENSVNVTVNKQELNDNEVAKICDIVMRETGRNASQIIIQSKF